MTAHDEHVRATVRRLIDDRARQGLPTAVTDRAALERLSRIIAGFGPTVGVGDDAAA